MAGLRRRLSTQIFALQVLILCGTLLVGFLLAVRAAQDRLDREHGRRALSVARSVAATPEVAAAILARDRSGVVQRRAERVRRATGTAFIVITDARGIRFSHPRPDRIGRRVSTDPSAALAGRTVVAVERGTLGRSARAKVPLRLGAGDRGPVVGQVSVGILESTIRAELKAALPAIAAYTVVSLAVGLVASLALAARLKRRTFGLELGEIADLLREREAMLHGIREGVIVVDPEGQVRMVNEEARRLLQLGGPDDGRSALGLAAPGTLADLIEGRVDGRDLVLVHADRLLVASRMPVRLDGRDLGAVITLRDRTEFEAVTRELDSARGLTNAMRAQAHEFSNRLHTVAGLLELGHHDEAIAFVHEITHADAALRASVSERITDPLVAALLVAKSAVAAERGVALELSPASRLDGELADAPTVLTVIGNLVDNALDAAGGDAGDLVTTARVEVELTASPRGDLRIRVADSGPGVPDAAREAIFDVGYSTKPAVGRGTRGVGLSLVRGIAERHGGHIDVIPSTGVGAVFEAHLPLAVRPADPEPLPT